jgi:septal ring factor EnvC (AmiA/AmiB activator)
MVLLYAALTTAALSAATDGAHAQGDLDRRIRDNQARLDSIRRERQDLESELQTLRGRARDITSEIRNIERQKSLTSRVVNELDRQMASMTSQLDTITMDLLLAQDALAETNAVLERRLAQIYKRGPLWAFQVLLAAESFGDLVSRYKYLHMISQQDRALSHEIEDLHDRISAQRRQHLSAQTALAQQRDLRGEELQRFVRLERQRQNTLQQTRASERATASRLDSLAAAATALNNLLTRLEDERRRAVARGERTDLGGSIRESDVGNLEWPLEGDVLYRFGSAPGPSGTAILYEGIGIQAPTGTPVRAVASGVVALAGLFGTYGPTIILDHGNGFRTVYLYLSRFDVSPGEVVTGGEIIGLSGGASSDHGPHIEFQIRQAPGGSSEPIALDPENWLRRRR